MKLSFVSYTHTDYSDIWCLMAEGVNKLSNLPIERILFCNTVPTDPLIQSVYNRVIVYDDSLTYPARVTSCLSQLTTEYVMFVHDIDIIVTFDTLHFSDIMNTVETYNLDRLFFGMVKPCNDMIQNKWLVLSRAKYSPIFALPYDVGPSIWKRSVFFDLMTKYRSETYRTIENSGIQKDLGNYRCYAIAPSPFYFPVYHLVRPMSSCFIFMHILASGKWFDTICYMDLQSELIHRLQKYNISMETRGIGNGYHLFHVSRSLDAVKNDTNVF